MKRPNITPGPWNFQPCPENTWNVSGHVLAKGQSIETATAMCKGEVNARAIAAVPALLEALENLFKRLQAVEVSKRWHEKPEEMDEAEFIRLISEEVAERGFLSEARSALVAAGYQF